MKVILRETVPDLGEEGQVVRVKDGYARNYLIPRGMAQPASGKNLKNLGNINAYRQLKKDRLLREAEQLAEKISEISLSIPKPVGESDRLFGTVTQMEIAEALEKKGLEVDKRKILIQDPIKSVGEYTVAVKLHAQVQAPLKIEVIEEEKE